MFGSVVDKSLSPFIRTFDAKNAFFASAADTVLVVVANAVDVLVASGDDSVLVVLPDAVNVLVALFSVLAG